MLNKILVAFLLLMPFQALADAQGEFNARCANRISAALVNGLPNKAVSGDPKANVSSLLESPDFIEQFARFINATFNDDPSELPSEDAAYHLIKHVLANKLPFSQLFLGRFNFEVENQGTKREIVTIKNDPNGVGYFETRPWKLRYAGNEENGVRIVAAYRILNNVTGKSLGAVTVQPGADNSAEGRKAPACAICHYDKWFALDKIASVLGRVQNAPMQNQSKFFPYEGGAKNILDGKMIADTRGLVTALVESQNYTYQACSLAFRFLNGRSENVCEAQVFDQCMKNFKKSDMMQDALKTFINDANFCQ